MRCCCYYYCYYFYYFSTLDPAYRLLWCCVCVFFSSFSLVYDFWYHCFAFYFVYVTRWLCLTLYEMNDGHTIAISESEHMNMPRYSIQWKYEKKKPSKAKTILVILAFNILLESPFSSTSQNIQYIQAKI